MHHDRKIKQQLFVNATILVGKKRGDDVGMGLSPLDFPRVALASQLIPARKRMRLTEGFSCSVHKTIISKDAF